MLHSEFLYQAYYCEENVWQLCANPLLADLPKWVLWITNPAQSCAVYCMRAGKPGAPVLWDYHVVLLTHGSTWQVWDLDTTLGLPVDLAAYLKFSFRIESGALAPRFRLVPAHVFREQFRSDRQHMHTAKGWLAPPPSWPAPSPAGASNLGSWINLEEPFHGEVCDLSTLLSCLARQRPRAALTDHLPPKQRMAPLAKPTTSLPSASAGEAISDEPVS